MDATTFYALVFIFAGAIYCLGLALEGRARIKALDSEPTNLEMIREYLKKKK